LIQKLKRTPRGIRGETYDGTVHRPGAGRHRDQYGSVANTTLGCAEWLVAAISGGSLEEIGNKGRLRPHIPYADVVSLPFPNHRHRLVASQCPPGSLQNAEAKSGSNQPFDPPVILLDSPIENDKVGPARWR